MKRFLLLILLCFSILGCGDEGIESVLEPQAAAFAPAAGGGVGPVPPHIQALLFDEFGSREELIDKLINLDWNDKNVDAEFMANWYLREIAIMDQKRAYYQKYISAGGVAVLGNADVQDELFIAAKSIILKMTAKRPEIRRKLYPRTGFYMAIRTDTRRPWDLPEYLFSSSPSGAIGKCIFACWAYMGYDYTTILPHGYPLKAKTFVHEFAHAIHSTISEDTWTRKDPPELLPPLDPTFDDRLKEAYEAAKAANKWRMKDPAIINNELVEVDVGPAYIVTNEKEYWAEGVVYWYYLDRRGIRFATREEFAAYDPLLYSLLSEWLNEDSFVGIR